MLATEFAANIQTSISDETGYCRWMLIKRLTGLHARWWGHDAALTAVDQCRVWFQFPHDAAAAAHSGHYSTWQRHRRTITPGRRPLAAAAGHFGAARPRRTTPVSVATRLQGHFVANVHQVGHERPSATFSALLQLCLPQRQRSVALTLLKFFSDIIEQVAQLSKRMGMGLQGG